MQMDALVTVGLANMVPSPPILLYSHQRCHGTAYETWPHLTPILSYYSLFMSAETSAKLWSPDTSARASPSLLISNPRV